MSSSLTCCGLLITRIRLRQGRKHLKETKNAALGSIFILSVCLATAAILSNECLTSTQLMDGWFEIDSHQTTNVFFS